MKTRIIEEDPFRGFLLNIPPLDGTRARLLLARGFNERIPAVTSKRWVHGRGTSLYSP